MTLKRINFTKEDATNLYLENYRYKVLNELKVQEIQNRIKNKLMKNTSKDENLDLIFYKNNISGFNLSDMSQLLSKDGSTLIETSNDDIDKELDDVENLEEDVENLEGDDVEQDDIAIIKNQELDITLIKKDIERKSKYIDLEAECSSDEDQDELEIDFDDEDSLIDNDEVDDTAHKLFYDQKEKEDLQFMKRLKSKFKPRKPSELEKAIIEVEESEEYEQGFSEMDLEIEAVKFRKIEYEDVKEEEINVVDGGFEFKNLGNAEKLNKREENFNFLKKK